MTTVNWIQEAEKARQEARALRTSARPLYVEANEKQQELVDLQQALYSARAKIDAYRNGNPDINDADYRAAVDSVADLEIKIERQEAIVARAKALANQEGRRADYKATQLENELRARFDAYQQAELRHVVNTLNGREG